MSTNTSETLTNTQRSLPKYNIVKVFLGTFFKAISGPFKPFQGLSTNIKKKFA